MPAPSGSSRVSLPAKGPGSAEWWAGQLEWAAEVRKKKLPDWKYSVNAYRDELTKPHKDAIRVNIEFEKTEQKRGQLFYRIPELRLKAQPRTIRDSLDPATGQPVRDLRKAIRIFREVLQRLAGPKGMDTLTLVNQCIFDLLCPAGLMACKVGFEQFEDGTIPVQIGEEPAPQPPGAVLGLAETPMVPIYGQGPNVIYERYFASRISPVLLRIPADYTDGDYSRDALWLAYDFFLTREEAKRKGWSLPADAVGSTLETEDDRLVPLESNAARREQLRCTEVFCYAARIYGDVVHPLKIYRYVFVEGVKNPVVAEASKDQRWDARGRLVGGITSLPIKVGTLRYVSDHAYPPSDCRISRRQADELSEFRTQQVIHRKKSIPLRWMDYNGITDERVRELVRKGEYYDVIPTDGPGDRFIGEVARAQYPRENNQFIDYLMNDADRLWALGANQQGVREDSPMTATQSNLIAAATKTRLSGEQGAVARFWLSIMEHTAQLVQLYADREDYVEIVGEDGAKAIEAWDKQTVQGSYLFDVVPDSSSIPDAAAERDMALNFYNLTRNDERMNGEQALRDVIEAYGREPERYIKPQEPPKPEPPKVSVSVKGEDLNPMMPQYPNVLTLLQANGVTGQMTPPAPPQPEPQRPADVVDRERLRMAEADEGDRRSPGGLVGAAQ